MLEKKIEAALKTVKERKALYGHSYLVNRYGALSLIVTKLVRYCNKWDKPHQDSIHDLGVYAFILETVDDSY